jgi:hypothetical protein
MTRRVAILLTILSIICCGLRGLGLLCFGGFGAVGLANIHEGTIEDAIAGLIIFICSGLFLLFIPLAVGLVSFRLSRQAEPSSPEQWD